MVILPVPPMEREMFDKKYVFATAVAVMFLVTCTCCAVDSDALASDNGYVTIEIEWNDDYITKGIDSTNRISAAEEVVDEQFSTISEASEAFSGLYDSGNDGNYTGTGYYTDVNGGSRTESYTNAHPLYYRASDAVPDINKKPVSSVTFTVHGEVEAGASSIQLGSGQGFHVNDVTLDGTDGAYVSGKTNIYASVAGGYASMFVFDGTFTVTGIEFEEASLNASGQAYDSSTSELRAKTTTLTVSNCVFHNQLYIYTEDPTYTGEIVKNIVDNRFVSQEPNSSYAFFLQGVASKLNFSGNIVDGFRGINIQEQTRDDQPLRLDAVIDGNTFTNNTNPKGCVQFTAADSFEFINNTMTGIEGNAFWAYPAEKGGSVRSIEISNNDIEADYLFCNQQPGLDISSSANILDIANPGKCLLYDDDTPVVTDSDVVIVGSPSDTGPSTPGNDDDEFVPPYIPQQSSGNDDTTLYIACCAAAAVVALLAIIIVMNERKR